MKRFVGLCLLSIVFSTTLQAQVDTTLIYDNSTPYGSLDIRIANTPSWYYYLQEGKTFSFREAGGVRTDTYRDMTSWESSPYQQAHLREKNGAMDNFIMNYRFLTPEGYDPNYNPGYPLLIIFHGFGEAANCSERRCYHADSNYSPNTNSPAAPTDSEFELLNNDHQLANGGNVHMIARNKAGTMLPNNSALPDRAFPGFIIFPQNLNGWDVGSVQHALRLLRLFLKKYNVDENRVYIHGLSNGGNGVYEAIKRAPWMFAAALTMSPIGDGNINAQKVAPSIAHIPLWTFQGGKDINPTPGKTLNFVRQFRAAGADVRYTFYENLGHGTWGTAFNEPDFFTWMLGKNRANIHPFGGNPVICGDTPLTLEVPTGFKSYQWEFNNQIIAGANDPTYQAKAAGTYRARFSSSESPSDAQWNRWSDPLQLTTSAPPAAPEIIQHGTVVLRDLNDNNVARLESNTEAGRYLWYKNGNLLDLPGDQDDTVKFIYITSSFGNGAYTLVTSTFSNCQSPPSVPKYVFFNNQAPVNITSPANLSGTATPAVAVQLSWTDASNNEMGFEIWRRPKINNTFGPWQMAALTATNAKSFTDIGLLPLTTYQYRIRGVSSTGRSEYTPAASVLEVKTLTDTEAPTAPTNFTLSQLGVGKIRLRWSPSTDNSQVAKYYVYFGDDSVATQKGDTTILLTKVPLNHVYTFYAKAIDVNGNLSAASNTRTGNTYVSGLYYEHSTGINEALTAVNWSSPEFTGVVPTFTLKPKTQEDYFVFKFDGFIYVTDPGSYQFRISSDDGSNLRVNNNLLVNNDGVHELKTVTSSPVNLSVGAHRIEVQFFEYVESDTLKVEYKGPDTNNQWSFFTNDVLKSAENIVTSVEDPSNIGNDLYISVFPNPTSQSLIQVRVENAQPMQAEVQMLSMDGRRLFYEVVDHEILAEGITITPSQIIPPGIYIILVRQDNKTSGQRLVIRD